MNKLFSVVGVSTLNGETKVRFANDALRVKVLRKNGHTDIQLVELTQPMTKVAAAEYILHLPQFQAAVSQGAIAEAIDRRLAPEPRAKSLPKAHSVPDLSHMASAPF